MNRHELKAAADAHSELERAERDRDAMLPYQIGRIGIERTERPDSGVTDLTPGMCGTGTVTSIGFPGALAEALTKTMHEYFDSRVHAAEEKLKSFGIKAA